MKLTGAAIAPNMETRCLAFHAIIMAMTQRKPQEQEQAGNSGLCGSCVHARRIVSAKESMFTLCQLGFSDTRFPKYPRLPVLRCEGFLRGSSGDGKAI
jgi:hypothetical protein